MPRGRPVDPETRAEALRLIRSGMGRNAVARELGISYASVTSISRELARDGSEPFDRSKSRLAVAARQVDLAELRSKVAVKLLVRADECLELMDQPYVVHQFGGMTLAYIEHEMDRPPAAEVRNYMVAAAVAVQRSIDLMKFDQSPDEEMSAVDGWLADVTKSQTVTDEGLEVPEFSDRDPEPVTES